MSAAAIASSTPGAGRAAAMPGFSNAQRFAAGAVAGPPLLEVDRLVGQHDLGVDLGVGHREHHGAERPARGQPGDGLAHGRAGAQPGGAGDVRAEVEVAELEPLPSDAPRSELTRDAERVIRSSPALGEVLDAREGVEHRVDVGLDAQAGDPPVVAGVADHGELVAGCERGPQSEGEVGPADPSGE